MKTRIIIITFFICLAGTAQVPPGFPRITEDNIEGGLVRSERTYTAESLFGYMNGGAELYLEYGFDRLVVSEIDIDGNDYKMEVYMMDDPEAAFGIYSVSVFKCDTSGHINDYSCQNPYQLQFCKGVYYVSIINSAGNREAFDESQLIAEELNTQITGRSFSIRDFLHGIPFEGEILKNTLIKGELGLFNGAYDWYDILGNADAYTALVTESENEAVLSIKFSDGEQQAELLKKLGIMSQPPVNDEFSIREGCTLAVNYDNVIMIRRSK
ncbi:MAG: hypothetical protein KFF49_04770 [Bacteroidales bacterium]|nr:hypothetical protein [Bacteroidales bacterium]